jgi:hypothetical protein
MRILTDLFPGPPPTGRQQGIVGLNRLDHGGLALSGGHLLTVVFASTSVGGYSVQLGLAVALLANTHSAALQRALVLVIVALYCSALGRAWVVTGITRRG